MVSSLEKMLKWILLFIFSIISTSLLPVIYLIKSSYYIIKEECWIYRIVEKVLGVDISEGLSTLVFLNITIYLIFPILLSLLILLGVRIFCSADSIKKSVQEVSIINNDYMPIYLGYIFVSVSIPNPAIGEIDLLTLMVVYLLVNVFVTASRSLCFNPIFVIFGYSYYSVKTKLGTNLFVITRKKISKSDEDVKFEKLRKITEIVYIEE